MSQIPVDADTARKLVALLRDHDVALLPAVRDYAAAMIEDILDHGHSLSYRLDETLFDEIETLFGRDLH